MSDIDIIELKKIKINKKLYSSYKTDFFELSSVLKILNEITIPVDIPINNNQIFIRDLTAYMVSNELEPNINKE
jgi:hypothetical protein